MKDKIENCPECKEGVMEIAKKHEDGGCSCHINPPCSYCVDEILACNNCSYKEELEHYVPKSDSSWLDKQRQEAQEEWERESKNPTKITSRVVQSWHSGREVEGYYPEGTSKGDVMDKNGCNYKQAMPQFRSFGNNYYKLSYFND